MSLKSGAADEVVPLPVFMLAEGAAVAGGVAAAARLAGFAPAVPATLQREKYVFTPYHMEKQTHFMQA